MTTERTGDLSRSSKPVILDRHVLKVQDNLWAEALGLAAVVESALSLSVTALCHHRPELAAEVKTIEREIDRREVAIESECLRVLALFEPLASDFRRVLTILRVNRDLERIGDLAARIAKRAKKLARAASPVPIPEPLESLAEAAVLSVRNALDSFYKVRRHVGPFGDRGGSSTRPVSAHGARGPEGGDSERRRASRGLPGADGYGPAPGTGRRPRGGHRRSRHLHERGPDHPTFSHVSDIRVIE